MSLVGVINLVKKYIPHKQSQHLLGDSRTYTFNVLLFFKVVCYLVHVLGFCTHLTKFFRSHNVSIRYHADSRGLALCRLLSSH
jgi:hypothetical protein